MALLGVNIDHVATVRNARGGISPNPVEAALIAETSGADGITAHLREDRRHIRDEDLKLLRTHIKTRLNLEMANTPEMLKTALSIKPYMVTLVPERRQELTTEGGLNVAAQQASLANTTAQLTDAGILVSFFIAPDRDQLEASLKAGAPFIELHTGPYSHEWAEATQAGQSGEEAVQKSTLQQLVRAAEWASEHNLKVNAGHGLNYENVQPVLSIPELVELNIGHSIIAEAIFTGLAQAVTRMKALL